MTDVKTLARRVVAELLEGALEDPSEKEHIENQLLPPSKDVPAADPAAKFVPRPRRLKRSRGPASAYRPTSAA